MPLIANIVSYLHYHKSDLVCFSLPGLIHSGQAFSMNNSNVIYRVNAGGASYSDSVQKMWIGNSANVATNNVNSGRTISSN